MFSGTIAFAETIVLKSGKQIQGKILEKTADYIKVDYAPAPLYYYWDNIVSIDGQALPGRAQKAQIQPAAGEVRDTNDREASALLDAKDKEIESLRSQLKETQQVRDDFAVLKQAFKKLQAKYYNNLGGTFLYEKAFENAAKAFEDALEIDPWNPEACFNLALLYDNYLKDTKAAVLFYERYLVLIPEAQDRRQIEERIEQLKRS
jgi:tetratricopeptide (TPR) repeat protein